MNGLNLLVLVSLFGQVSAPPMGGAPNPNANYGKEDFGWHINEKDNILEYIIQVSPEQAKTMQNRVNGQQMEKASLMPEALVGRAQRIVVRIGSDALPRTPSLAEIERTIPRFQTSADLSSLLGPGNMSEMDRSPVVNVQNRGPSSLIPDAQNEIDRARAVAEQGGLPNLPNVGGAINGAASAGNDFLNRARDRLTDQDPPSLPGTSGLPPFPSTSNTSKFNQTGDPQQRSTEGWEGRNRDLLADNRSNAAREAAAQQAAMEAARRDATARQDPRSAPSSYTGTAGIGTDRRDRGVGGFNGYDTEQRYDDYNRSEWQDPRQNPAYTDYVDRADPYRSDQVRDSRASRESRSTAQEEPEYLGGFDKDGYDRSGFDRGGYDRNGYDRFGKPRPEATQVAQLQQPSTPSANPNANPNSPNAMLVSNGQTLGQIPFPNTGSNLAGQLPATNPASGTTTSGNEGQSASDKQLADSREETVANTKKAGDAFVQMFFLVSLVANVYLVFLIRKLLTRYRSLLTTVRGQAI